MLNLCVKPLFFYIKLLGGVILPPSSVQKKVEVTSVLRCNILVAGNFRKDLLCRSCDEMSQFTPVNCFAVPTKNLGSCTCENSSVSASNVGVG